MPSRPHGSGWIETRPGRKPRARYRNREGKTVTISADTEEQAERLLDATMVAEAEGGPRGLTVGRWGEMCIDQRVSENYRTIPEDRSRWRKHVTGTWLEKVPLRDLSSTDVIKWRDELIKKKSARGGKLARSTVRHCLTLLRRVLERAVEKQFVDENAAFAVRLPANRTKHARKDTSDKWTYLTREEVDQVARCEEVSAPDRLRVLFAVATGLRQGEQWNLELSDIVVDGPDPHVMVRYGGPNHEPPKSGKVRKVPLFEPGLSVARAWLHMLPGYVKKNPHNLVFPTPRGARRQRSKTYGWHDIRAKSGIHRPVRWHDLRHTCASFLVAGWWGRIWQLHEVRDYLGHTDIKTTQIYAHLAPSALRRAADETVLEVAPLVAPQLPPKGSNNVESLNGTETTIDLRSQRSCVRIAPDAQDEKPNEDHDLGNPSDYSVDYTGGAVGEQQWRALTPELRERAIAYIEAEAKAEYAEDGELAAAVLLAAKLLTSIGGGS